jgi:hypothetical protein
VGGRCGGTAASHLHAGAGRLVTPEASLLAQDDTMQTINDEVMQDVVHNLLVQLAAQASAMIRLRWLSSRIITKAE